MTDIFLDIVNMSITASVLAVIVLLTRLLLKKAPKWISVLLWGLVAIRLICPFTVESPFSLMPETDWIEQESVAEDDLYLNSVPDSIPAIDFSSLGKDVTVHYYPTDPEIEIHRGVSISFVFSCIWLGGIAVLLLHTLISTIHLHRSVGAAIRVKDNIWESSAVDSPFVLGLLSPRIYVPRGMTEDKLAYVIAHEQAHIRRKDHWWKPMGFLLLTVHWFNPVMWLSYILLCRDIEMACDERVVKEYDEGQRANYSEALLECSVKRSMISACPLAFGEVGVKQRIKSVLHYKKPAFWIVVLAVVACIAAAVCFLTNPQNGGKAERISVDAEQISIYLPERIYTDFGDRTREGLDKLFGLINTLSEGEITALTELPEISDHPDAISLHITIEHSDHLELLTFFMVGEQCIFQSIRHDIETDTQERLHLFEFRSALYQPLIEEVILSVRMTSTAAVPVYEETEVSSLTLADVITLSAKGHDLTWEDFAGYNHTDIGSGLFIWLLPIDETFSVKVGGGSTRMEPMYVYLCAKSGEEEERIDIRDGGVEEFIELQTNMDDGLLFGHPIRYYVNLAWEEAKQVAKSQNVEIDKNRYSIWHNNDAENVWVGFFIKTETGWPSKTIEIIMTQNEDGTYKAKENSLVVVIPPETTGEVYYEVIPDGEW